MLYDTNALSAQSPTVPIDWVMPNERQAVVKQSALYWADVIGVEHDTKSQLGPAAPGGHRGLEGV